MLAARTDHTNRKDQMKKLKVGLSIGLAAKQEDVIEVEDEEL